MPFINWILKHIGILYFAKQDDVVNMPSGKEIKDLPEYKEYLKKKAEGQVTKPLHGKKESAIPITAAPEGRIKKILYNVVQIFHRLFFTVFYKVEVEGLENIPLDGSLILAANHASFLDPMLLSQLVPRRCRALAGAWLFKIKLIAWALKATDSIPAEGSVKEAIAALGRGDAILIFPEGKCRCKAEKFAAKPHKGVALFALKTGAPVVPIYVKGTFEAWPNGKIFPRFFKKLKVHIGKPFKLNQYKEEVIPAPILEKALQDIMTAIKELAKDIL